MPLAVTTTMTTLDPMDVDSSATGALETDFAYVGTGCIGVDVDIETADLFNGDQTAVDLTASAIAVPMLCMTQPTLDTKVNGGMRICAKDSAGNISRWFVGGKDTYNGGWEVMVAHTSIPPDETNGTAATLTDIVAIGTGWKCLQKSKLAQNCFMDRADYGAGAVVRVTGTNTTTDIGWAEVLSVADSQDATRGYIKAQTGSYIPKGPIEVGDNAGTLSTTFSDNFNELVFGDMPVTTTYYSIKAVGNATGATSVTLKNQVLKSAGARFVFNTNDANVTSFSLTGSTVAKAGLTSFRAGQTITTTVFNDCLQIDPSTATFQDNTVSNSADTNGALLWPSVSTNISSVTFISSGTGNAIYITSTGTKSLQNITLSGYAATGNVNAAVRNNSGGAVTLQYSGGTLPTYYNLTTSTTTVESSVTVTFTGLPNPTDCWLYLGDPNDSTNATLEANEAAVADGTFAVTTTAGGQEAYAVFMNTTGLYKLIHFDPAGSGGLPSSNADIPVSFTPDRVYAT